MAISRDFIQDLHDRLDIEEVISSYVSLKPTGRLRKGLCPFHGEKTASFTVYPDTRSFYCFGCGAAGDVIDFIMRIENLDYVEAVKACAELAGVAMPEDGYDDSLAKRRVRLLSANREAAKFFNACLNDEKNRFALDYFLKRGLTPNTIKKFGLGYAPDSWRTLTDHLKRLGFSEQELVLANLSKRSQKNDSCYDNFRNRVMFPIIDVRGNVVAFGGRVLDDSKPKYVNTSDTPVYKKGAGVFALNFAKNNPDRRLMLVEGYMDVIALHQAGFTGSVACLGTAFTSEQANILARYADEVLICYDNDEAGRKATQRALEILGRTSLKIKVIKMEGGKDADEILRTYGKERFNAMITGASNQIEYNLSALQARYNISKDDGKLRFLSDAAEVLAECSDLEVDIYSTRLANELGVSKDALLAQIKSARGRHKRRMQSEQKSAQMKMLRESFDIKSNPERRKNLKAAAAEETLIASLMRNPDFYAKLKDKFTPDDFVTDFNRRVITLLIELIEGGYQTDISMFNEGFSPDEIDSIALIAQKGEETANTLKECEDCIAVLKKEKSAPRREDSEEMADEDFSNYFKNKEKNK